MGKILDGAALAKQIKTEIKTKAGQLERAPGLAVILVGDDPASRVYVTSKRKDCIDCGFHAKEYLFPAEVQQKELTDLIVELNDDVSIDGILVQMPLPKHIDQQNVVEAITPGKDVDCFHPYNVGRLHIGQPTFWPCTPYGVMELLRLNNIGVFGKRCVVVGRSNIVGRPMASLLEKFDGTVTLCHSHTRNLSEICREADILVSAVGQIGVITEDRVKTGAVVIDVAMNRDENGKLCGDCVPAVYEKSYAYTPVPGGVGPMTRAMLMKNTLMAAMAHQGVSFFNAK